MAPRGPLTVTELTADIRSVLESGFAEVAVEGELSNCKLWHTGHLYFTLKDAGAQIRGVMFRSAVRSLKFKAEDGQHVVARGRVSVYDAKGEYQIVCEALEPKGLGALQLAFEQLKKRLDAAGLFDPARKRPLPVLPRKIGVVTSLDGAAIRDILSVLAKRYPQAHVVIRPARVQGEGAAQEVARGLQMIARVDGVDVVIVGRGGGSIEDLWAFNEEIVARAIVACPVPVISAVGHETDVTIADFVADLRAADAVGRSRARGRAARRVRRAHRSPGRAAGCGARQAPARAAIARARARQQPRAGTRAGDAGPRAAATSASCRSTCGTRWPTRVRACTRRLVAGERALERHDPRRRLAETATRLTAGRARLDAAIERRRSRDVGRLGTLAGRLDSLSPLAVLGRGYAVCWDATRTHVIRAASEVGVGDTVRVTLGRGRVTL